MPVLDQAQRDLLFLDARTHNGWLDKPVTDETLRELYDLTKMGPTSANSQPLRFGGLPQRRRQGEAQADADGRQRRQDDAGAGHRHHRPRQ